MKNIISTSIIVFIVAAFISCRAIYEDGQELANSVRHNIEEISVDELNKKTDNYEDFLLIDIRQADEFQHVSIPGSFNIPRGVLEFKIRDDNFWEEEFFYAPLEDDEIIVYCKLGHRGALAALSLQQLGFTNVKSLKGGILSWDPEIEQNLPKTSGSGGCGD